MRAAAVAVALVAACAPLVVPPGPDMRTPTLAEDRLIAADGAALPLRKWLPKAGAPKAAIIAVHGFNDYSNFFADPGTWFAGQGFAAYAYDQRGFGAAPHPGLWPGTPALVADLKAMVVAVRARHPGVPLYLVGASMGGAVVMAAMTDPDPPTVDGIVLSAPAVWGRPTMPWYQRAALAVGSHTLPWWTVTGRGLGITPSDNIEMLKGLARDPLVIKETRIDAVHGLVDLMDAALAAAPRLDAPALILYGVNDEVIPRKPTLAMLRSLPAAGRARTRIAVYSAGYHMLLRDLQAKTVWIDIAAWIERRARPLPSAADLRAAAFLAEEPG